MKKRKTFFRTGLFWFFLFTLIVMFGSGCSIRVAESSSQASIENSTEISSNLPEASKGETETEKPDSESSSIKTSSLDYSSESSESTYTSILDFIPEHRKHFLQKKERADHGELSEEENSEEESHESEESEENPEEESLGEEFKDDEKTQYLIRINRSTHVATVYSKDENGNHTIPVKSMICSTGSATPNGTFMMGYHSRWKGISGGQWAQYVSHISGDYLIQSVPYRRRNADSMETGLFNALGTGSSDGSVYFTVGDAYWIYMNCDAYNTLIQIGFFGNTDPWGKPSMIKLSENQETNWDPTDPADGNPWNTKTPYFTGVRNYTIEIGERTPDLLQNVRGYDTCGNDQTGLIRVTGSVNGYVAGTYTITYYLTDVLGRTGVQKAYVTVQGKPQNSKPENPPSQSSTPESSTPESSTPESSTPESSTPESSTPESSAPESSAPESSTPESSTPESSTPESSTPDSSTSESSTPEGSTSESSIQENESTGNADAHHSEPEDASGTPSGSEESSAESSGSGSGSEEVVPESDSGSEDSPEIKTQADDPPTEKEESKEESV